MDDKQEKPKEVKEPEKEKTQETLSTEKSFIKGIYLIILRLK